MNEPLIPMDELVKIMSKWPKFYIENGEVKIKKKKKGSKTV
jgi:hypothetical protein